MVWSVAIVVQRIGGEPSIHPTVNIIEDIAAFLLPPATLHIALSVAVEGRRPASASWMLAAAYVVGIATSLQAVVDPGHPIAVDAPHASPFGIAPALAGWLFIAIRAGIFGAAVAWLVSALRAAGDDRARQRQLQFALATVVLGVVGGMLRILPEGFGGPKWIGVSIIALAMVMAAYAVLAQHLFLAADAAGRAFRWSVLMGLAVVSYVGALVLVDRVVSAVLGVDLPIVIGLAVVITLALFDPIADVAGRVTAEQSGQGPGYARLLRALGSDIITSQRPERAIVPALSRLVRTFDLSGAEVVDPAGRRLAAVGTVGPADGAGLQLPLRSDEASYGLVRFGPKRSGLPLIEREVDSLGLAASYLAGSLRLAARHDEQASALEVLSAEVERVAERGTELSRAITDAADEPAGLYVYALGSLRAERDGEPVRRWGGEKAGSRQAEGVFAFLFDRGERGATKDEILELIWPDVDLDRADVAFHRTLLGLRSMLQPDRRRRRTRASAITFHNDRYRLDPSVIAGSDVAELDRLLSEAGRGTPEDALRAFEQGRALYRGDYLDDCPFYGDSAEVEDRRQALRSRYVDLLVELGERYAERGDRAAAAASFRDAQALSEDDLPRVVQALQRLTMPQPLEP